MTSCYETGHHFILDHCRGHLDQNHVYYIYILVDIITRFGRDNNLIGKCIIYQLSYEILDIIMKMSIYYSLLEYYDNYFFNMLSQQQHINMQIR